MTNRIYPARIYQSSKTGEFTVLVPDVPGFGSAGSNVDDCLISAPRALAVHFDLMAEQGEEIPTATPLLQAIADQPNLDTEDLEDLVGTFPLNVTLPGEFERVSISLDKGLLARIDEAAGPMKRSQFLDEAARTRLLVMTPPRGLSAASPYSLSPPSKAAVRKRKNTLAAEHPGGMKIYKAGKSEAQSTGRPAKQK